MELQKIADGGLQSVPQVAVQYVYLDFDGELTRYDGEILTVDRVEVKDSSLTEERIAHIVAALNAQYAAQNVIFVTEKTATAEYSTIYIGKTSAFDQYGNFAGLAETIDEGNENKSDNAFVMLDSTASDEAIISTICHETDHLLGTLNHGGKGLDAYAAHTFVGTTSTCMIITGGNSVTVQGGLANSTTIYSGCMYLSRGGVASNTVMNGGALHISQGGRAVGITGNGGWIHVASGGTVSAATIRSYCMMSVAPGGLAVDTWVGDGEFRTDAEMELEGAASKTKIFPTGSMCVRSGGIADLVTVKGSGYLYIFSGGNVHSAVLEGEYLNSKAEMRIDGGTADDTVTNRWGDIHVSSGGIATRTMVSGGSVFISSGGIAHHTVVRGGALFISSGGAVEHTTVSSGRIIISSGGIACNTAVTVCTMVMEAGGLHRGSLQIFPGMYVSASQGSVIDFSVAGRCPSDDYLIDHLSMITGTPTYTITVADDQEFGTYRLAQGAENFTGTISIGSDVADYGSITVNGDSLVYDNRTYSLKQTDGNLTLTIRSGSYVAPTLSGDAHGITWENISGNKFVVEYSKDNCTNILQLETENNAVDTFGLPAGNWQWRVKADDGNVVTGNAIQAGGPNEARLRQSDADGDLDLFFANANGTWSAAYAAEHHGILNGWAGTSEQVELTGKNKIADVFSGSSDANILALTDSANGDALFVEDIYTSFGKDAARIAQIDEIRAGAGDDIVDMTSQQFAYSGHGVKIYGGLGNDTIWANNGNNTLFGDAGNDRLVGGSGNDVLIGGAGDDSMHGGGGADTFCFGDNWGNDTIEQLANGSVTLWFETGSQANWDAENLTYTDGSNSVTVIGVSNVTLRFGNTADAVDGAFADAASEKIFEDANKGMIA